jgi:hypothetical protein
MLPSIIALKLAVECVSPWPFAADVSAAEATTSLVMRMGASKMLHCTIAKRRGL